MNLVSFGSVCDLQNGRAFKPSEWAEAGTPIVRIQNLNDETKSFNYCNFEVEDRFHIQSGDLLFSWSGTPGTSFGAFFWNRGKAFLNQHIFRVDIDENVVDKNYLRHAINSKLTHIIDHAHGGVGLKHITKGKLEAVEIYLPKLAEQKRIAAILDKADSLRRKNQQAIQLADQFLRAVFLDMFGDPVTNPKGWDVRELDDCLIFLTSGSRGWAKHYSSSGDKFIRIQNVSKNKLLLNDLAYVNAPVGAEANRTKTQIGDVLLSITADLGRAAVVTEEIAGSYINQHLALLRVKQDKLNPRYFAAYLSSEAGVTQFKAKNKSAVKAGLNFTDIRTLNILLPAIELQNKYEELYKKVTFSINFKQESLQFSESLFKSLSQKAFAGKL
ncbi:hypothetical protein A1359_03770 [Methylomonas lenta]|uniref:Type I restriction modification DNA specificity domain-containing protein n=1 Tax=Methylomonas lenta TaxID=980561 RepID=A0A177NNF0_9GAMM|nr:restriction endonuclease subunit S [Methylomonas lenta]OAI19421.1 hypothetical protein A1359_03770 [Methylomonas lenta]